MKTLLAAVLLALPLAGPLRAQTGYENWFTDTEELDRNWVEVHEDARLPQHKRRFCAVHASNSVARELRDHLLFGSLAFENPPGSFNTGLCWFHSRYQRAASYLANFRPDLPRPTRERGAELALRIMDRSAVVEIPGFNNLREFSEEYRQEITGLLDRMGVGCFLNPMDCAQRLGDTYDPTPEDMATMMRSLYEQMFHQPGEIQFLRTRADMFQSGISRTFGAHSLLVLEMAPLRDKGAPHAPGMPAAPTGYTLLTIDPNFPNDRVVLVYRFGDRRLTWQNSLMTYTLAPYRHYEYMGDINDFDRAARAYCRPDRRAR